MTSHMQRPDPRIDRHGGQTSVVCLWLNKIYSPLLKGTNENVGFVSGRLTV